MSAVSEATSEWTSHQSVAQRAIPEHLRAPAKAEVGGGGHSERTLFFYGARSARGRCSAVPLPSASAAADGEVALDATPAMSVLVRSAA